MGWRFRTQRLCRLPLGFLGLSDLSQIDDVLFLPSSTRRFPYSCRVSFVATDPAKLQSITGLSTICFGCRPRWASMGTPWNTSGAMLWVVSCKLKCGRAIPWECGPLGHHFRCFCRRSFSLILATKSWVAAPDITSARQ